LLLQWPDDSRAGLKFGFDGSNTDDDFGNGISLKIVDQHQLRQRAIRNALHLILAVNVRLEDAAAFKCHLGRLAVGVQNDSVFAGGTAGRHAGFVR